MKPKVAALYKTFSGDEFVKASLESIYDRVDKIVMVNSDISWSGRKGNTVVPVVEQWGNEHDQSKKIHHLQVDTQSQTEQYDEGFSWIKRHTDCDWVLLIDTDEVWDDAELSTLWSYLEMDEGMFDALCVRLFTYIKTPTMQINPPEPLMPVVLVRASRERIDGVRGNGIRPKGTFSNVWMHHFSMVRKSREEIKCKVVESITADGMQHVDIDKWMSEKWDQLPNVTDFHTTRNCEGNWKGVIEVTNDMLPSSVQKMGTALQEMGAA